MKKTKIVILGMMAFYVGNASAQTSIDVDAINQKNASVINGAIESKHHQRAVKFKQGIKNLGKNAVEALESQVKLEDGIAPSRVLSELDVSKKELLQCVDQILDKNYGGYDAPKVAQTLLLSAMNQNGWLDSQDQIDQAAENCRSLRSSLYRFPDRTMDKKLFETELTKLPITNAAENKSVMLIKAILKPKVLECTQLELNAKVIAGLGVNAGLGAVKCLLSDGRVHHGVIANIGFHAGIGAQVSLVRNTEETGLRVAEGKFFIASNVNPENNGEAKSDFSLGVGTLENTTENRMNHAPGTKEFVRGPSVGLLAGINFVEGGVGFRIPNGKRHWDQLIDLLN